MGLDKSNGKKPEHAKCINNVRNNGENPRLIEQIMALKQIKIQSLLWATRSTALAIHTCTNDIKQEINTIQMQLRNWLKS